MDQGWLKLHRKLTENPIWKCSTPEQKTVLVVLLLMANHTEKEWEWNGKIFTCKPGEFITSLRSIAEQCGKGVSVQNVRTALVRFEKLGFLTNESTNKNRKIRIENWTKYQTQGCDEKSEQASYQQAANKQLTTNKNDKNDKNDKNIYSFPASRENVYEAIINHLNFKTGNKFKVTSSETRKLIAARLDENYELEDFIKVIDIKKEEWMGTKWGKYLRPSTLFKGENFEKYLEQSLIIEKSTAEEEELRKIGRMI